MRGFGRRVLVVREPGIADALDERDVTVTSADANANADAVADREAVFERGFTTAEDGIGFGLDIVRQIARAHDCAVTCEASDSGGARFSFDLDAAHTSRRASNGRTGATD